MKMLKDMPVESQAWGWITALFGMLTLTEWSIVIGIVITICNFYRESKYKKRMLELEEIRAGIRDKNGKVISNGDS
ncbi:HP1 family phage holin [Pasteurella bettyae]|uniref:HP1 family phage holin n=1 Tax=Pasteurella bettyae TaxID=752 RepID=UPI003D2A0BD5